MELAAIQSRRSDDGVGAADLHPRLDWLRAKGRKQGAENASCLQGSKCRDIKLWLTPEQRVNPVAAVDALRPKDVCKAVGRVLQVAVRVCFCFS